MKKNVYFAIAPVLGLALVVGSVVAATPGHGYVSVPAAAFRPQDQTYQYINDGDALWVFSPSLSSFYAPVQLPQGATVTKVTFYWQDGYESGNGLVWLMRSALNNTSQMMAAVYTFGPVMGQVIPLHTETSDIDYAVIDNSQYGYYLSVTLWAPDVQCHGVIIEYTYQSNLSLVVRNLQAGLRER